MTELWYVARGDKQCGPFSAGQLRKFAAAGKIRLTDTVRRDGTGTAVPAANVKNLFPAPAAETQPPEAPRVAADVAPSSPPQLVGLSPTDLARPDGLPDLTDMQLMPDGPTMEVPEEEIDPTPAIPASPKKPANRHEEPARKRYAVALKGAIILNQDGVSVYYRKKCSQCGYEADMRSTMRIGQGVTRDHFFCRKCRKNREVEIRGQVQ